MKRSSTGKVSKKLGIIEIVIVLAVVVYFFFQTGSINGTIDALKVFENPETQVSSQAGEYTSSQLEVYFFDVGQADSILLLTDGKAMLVDTGNAGDADVKDKLFKDNINLTHELIKLGVSKIDVMVATHPHEDHMGSMYKIINGFDVAKVYANAPEEKFMGSETGYYNRFLKAMEDKNVSLITPTVLSESELKAKHEANQLEYIKDDYIRVGDTFMFGNAKITLLAPNAKEYSDINDYSLVFLVEFEDVKLMLTGDAGVLSEKEMLEYASKNNIDLDCDILKVSHHGSRTANSEAFISAVKPEYAIVMVEEGNSYGLPDEDVIERLQKHQAIIYQTEDEGDIRLVINDGEYKFDLDYSHEEKVYEK